MTITTPLFEPDPDRAGSALAALPALPPGSGESAEAITAWLHGETSDPLGYAVRAGAIADGDRNDLLELESQVFNDPAGALETFSARPRVTNDPDDAAWLTRTARALRPTAPGPDKAAALMAESLRKTSCQIEKDKARALHAGGAEARFGDGLITAIRAALAAERAFLEDGPGDVTGPPQILLGAPRPQGDLSGPVVLDRAAHIHLLGPVGLPSALRLALTEFRCSQAVRVTGLDATLRVDARFDANPAAPLAELTQTISPEKLMTA